MRRRARRVDTLAGPVDVLPAQNENPKTWPLSPLPTPGEIKNEIKNSWPVAAASDAVDSVKDAAKHAKDSVKDAAKGVKEGAKDAASGAKDAPKKRWPLY